MPLVVGALTGGLVGLGGLGEAAFLNVERGKRFLREELGKINEECANLISDEIGRISKEIGIQIRRAKDETLKALEELNMESHHLKKWARQLEKLYLREINEAFHGLLLL